MNTEKQSKAGTGVGADFRLGEQPDSDAIDCDLNLRNQVFTALTFVANRLAISLDLPAEISGNLDSALEQISEFSGVPIIRFQLNYDAPPAKTDGILGIQMRDDSSRIIVLHQGAHGGWYVLDCASGKIERLTRYLKASIAPWGWQLVPTFGTVSGLPIDLHTKNPRQTARDSNSLVEIFKLARSRLGGGSPVLLLALLASLLLSFAAPLAFQTIVDTAIPTADVNLLLGLVTVVIVLNCTQAMVVFSRTIALLRIQTSGTDAVQSAVWWRLLLLPIPFFRSQASGDLVYRSMLVANTSWQIGSTVLQGGLSAITAMSSVALAAWLAPSLLVYAIPLTMLESLCFFGLVRKIRQLALRQESLRARLTGEVTGWMQGIIKIRSADAEKLVSASTQKTHCEIVDADCRLQILEDLRRLLGIVIPAASTLIIFGVGFHMVTTGTSLTLGTFAAFIAAYRTFASGTVGVANFAAEMLGARAQLQLLEPILNAEVEEYRTRTDPGPLRGHIAFEKVAFQYPNSDASLRNVNLECKPGEFVGIVGTSGSGKSTLLRLLLGFEQTDQGRITLDGVDIRSLNIRSVRKQIGCVLQESKIMSGTIRENVSSGRTLTSSQVLEALRLVDLAVDVEHMPLQLDTPISQNGSNLSGGQGHRLLLARAVARAPKILILDEALRGLDISQQDRILRNIQSTGCSILMVSHRLDSLRNANRVYRVANGHVTLVEPEA